MTAQVPGVSIDRSGRSPTRTFGVATALAAMLAAGAGCVAEEAVDPDPELVDAGDDDVVDGAPDDDRDADPGAPDARPDDPRDPDAGVPTPDARPGDPDAAPPPPPPPDTFLTQAPPPRTREQTATFGFSASGQFARFWCSVDGAPAAECTSLHTVTGLAAGAHTFEVHAEGFQGQVDPTPARHAWFIDLEVTGLVIDNMPPREVNYADVEFEFHADEDVTFECKIDDGGLRGCSGSNPRASVFAASVTGEGAHTFTVRATDDVGNVATASRTWTYDTVAPTIEVVRRPDNVTNATAATVEVRTNEPVNFTCWRDDGPASCGAITETSISPSFAGFTAGPHSIKIEARDFADNARTTTIRWTVDLTPPTVTITSGPDGPTSDTTPAFAFTTGAGSVGTQCRIDTQPFVACTSPHIPTVAVGAHTFAVRATDAAGNTATKTRAFTVDLTAPTLRFTTAFPEAVPTNFTFGWSSSESATFQCELKKGGTVVRPRAACGASGTASSVRYEGMPVGQLTITVTGTDGAGNASTASREFCRDTVVRCSL